MYHSWCVRAEILAGEIALFSIIETSKNAGQTHCCEQTRYLQFENLKILQEQDSLSISRQNLSIFIKRSIPILFEKASKSGRAAEEVTLNFWLMVFV